MSKFLEGYTNLTMPSELPKNNQRKIRHNSELNGEIRMTEGEGATGS
jgi:hypothetical protein